MSRLLAGYTKSFLIFRRLMAVLCIGILPVIAATAQVRVEEGRLIRKTYSGSNVEAFDLNPPSVQGTNYLHDEWRSGSVALVDGRNLQNLPLRLDLEYYQLEVKTPQGQRVIPGRAIRQYEWQNPDGNTEFFLNSVLFNPSNDLPEGFFEIVYEGPLTLARKTERIVSKPMYNQALDAGHKDTRILKKVELYFIDKSDMLSKVPGNKSAFFTFFGPLAGEMGEFQKSRRLNIRDTEAIVMLLSEFERISSAIDQESRGSLSD